MTFRERVTKALNFEKPDKIPLEIHPSPAGLYEHGQKLLDLMRECGHDFGDSRNFQMPQMPGSNDFDSDGRYHLIKTDEWGTKWEYRIFGIWGHPIEWPLNDLNKLEDYKAPPVPPIGDPKFKVDRINADVHKQQYFLTGNGGELFEEMRSLRRFEYILMDIEDNTPEINRIADIIMNYDQELIKYSLALNVDAVTFGDDLGTSTALMISPATFRRFFKTRYRNLFDPVVHSGKHVVFHSCGQIMPVLEDLREVGVSAVWPQLPLYDLLELSRCCRNFGISVKLHPDRGELMQRGSPDAIRKYVYNLLETFDTANGGSWLYIEIDPGFPFENAETLLKIAMELRK